MFDADRNKPGDVAKWTEGELSLLVEEGRRQLDRVSADLDELRGRAQILLTTGTGVLVVAATATKTVGHHGGLLLFLAWAVALLVALSGVLGAASVLVVRADLDRIHATVVSRLPQPVLRSLAEAYAGCVTTGENTFATRLTVFRDAVLLVLLGGAALFMLWVWALT